MFNCECLGLEAAVHVQYNLSFNYIYIFKGRRIGHQHFISYKLYKEKDTALCLLQQAYLHGAQKHVARMDLGGGIGLAKETQLNLLRDHR